VTIECNIDGGALTVTVHYNETTECNSEVQQNCAAGGKLKERKNQFRICYLGKT